MGKNGDEDAKFAINTLMENLADGITNITAVLNPEMIILGGGIMAQSEYLRPLIDNALKQRLVEDVYTHTKVDFAKLENDAGMLGALYNLLHQTMWFGENIMKILHQLDRPNFKASKSDKILIRYIKEHAEEFCTTPIASLAINCGVSEATITRFVRKMGFASLQLFKLTLTEEMVNNKQRTIISKDITCDESIIITANKLLANNIATLEQTVSGLDEDILLKSVNMLKKLNVYFL